MAHIWQKAFAVVHNGNRYRSLVLVKIPAGVEVEEGDASSSSWEVSASVTAVWPIGLWTEVQGRVARKSEMEVPASSWRMGILEGQEQPVLLLSVLEVVLVVPVLWKNIYIFFLKCTWYCEFFWFSRNLLVIECDEREILKY